jgi:hypothetical protein
MQRRSVPRTDPRYNHLRARNNDSVKKSREKSRREHDETVTAITQLEEENNDLTQHINTLKQEYEQLQQLFKQHTGIAIDQLMSTESASSIPPPAPVEQPKETSKPVLTINTNDEKKPTASSEPELDASDLDGAIVVINGVQYKIVSMNKT